MEIEMSSSVRLVSSVRRPAVEAVLERVQRVAARRAGTVVVFVGAPGSGRTSVLHGVEEELRHARRHVCVVAGSFATGTYVPWARGESRLVGAVAKAKAVVDGVLTLGGPFATALPGGPLAVSAGRIASQLIGTSVALRKRFPNQRALENAPHDALELKSLLRRAAEDEVVVCLLDDLDRASGGVWWTRLIESFAYEIANDLPLLLVATTAAATSASDQFMSIAQRLESRRVAEVHQLAPIDSDDLREWLKPCSSEVVEALIHATGGQPRWIEELWEEWVRRGAVARIEDGAPWQFAGGDSQRLTTVIDIVDARLAELVGDDPRALDDAKRCLACGALEGREFAAPAVARVLDRDENALIDDLDEILSVDVARPAGLVVEADTAVLGEGPSALHIWRYAFVSDLHRHALRRYHFGPDERRDVSLRYANVLKTLYAGQAERVAFALAELFETGGDRATGLHYRQIGDLTAELDLLLEQTRLVREADRASWDDIDHAEALYIFVTTADAMRSSSPYPDTLAVFEDAWKLANDIGALRDRALALFGCGQMKAAIGDLDDAVGLLERARKELLMVGETDQATSALISLAEVEMGLHRLEEAHKHYSAALAEAREPRSPLTFAGASLGLSRLAYLAGDLPLAEGLAAETVELRKAYGAPRHNVLAAEFELAQIRLARHGADATIESLRQLERAASEERIYKVAAATARILAHLAADAGRRGEARERFTRSVFLSRSIGDRAGEEHGWSGVADVARDEGRMLDAAICYAVAHTLHATRTSVQANLRQERLFSLAAGGNAASIPRLLSAVRREIERDGGATLTRGLAKGWPPDAPYVAAARVVFSELPTT